MAAAVLVADQPGPHYGWAETVVTSNTATWSQLSRISCLLPSPVRMKRRISSAAADALVALLLTSNSAVPLILTCR